MKRFLIAAALAFATFAAQAAETTTITLTKEQAAALAQAAEKNPKNISATVREEASAWGEMGANMGRALVGAAKEVGVAANEFSQTPLGKVTVAIVVYKLVGQDLLSFVIGTAVLIAGAGFAVYFFRSKTLFASRVEYVQVPVLWGAFTRSKIVKTESNDEAVVFRGLLGVASMVFGLLVGLTTIF